MVVWQKSTQHCKASILQTNKEWSWLCYSSNKNKTHLNQDWNVRVINNAPLYVLEQWFSRRNTSGIFASQETFEDVWRHCQWSQLEGRKCFWPLADGYQGAAISLHTGQTSRERSSCLKVSRAEAETTCPGRRHEYNRGVGKAFVTRTENPRHSKKIHMCISILYFFFKLVCEGKFIKFLKAKQLGKNTVGTCQAEDQFTELMQNSYKSEEKNNPVFKKLGKVYR